MSGLIVIYDDGCKYCSTSTNIIEKISESITRVSLSDQRSKEFIDKQFEDNVFTLITIDLDTDTVHLGEDALNKINNSITESERFSRLIPQPYEQISEFTSLLEGRDEEITDYEGVKDITSEARLIAEDMLND